MDLIFDSLLLVLSPTMNLTMDQWLIVLVVAIIVAVVAWRVREGFDVGTVEQLPNVVNLADHLDTNAGGMDINVENGPNFVASLSQADVGEANQIPYYTGSQEEMYKDEMKECGDLQKVWEPLA